MRCPICEKPVDDATAGVKGTMFPFCSDRCRLIDLGRWLDGKYQIEAVDESEESDDESTGTPRGRLRDHDAD